MTKENAVTIMECLLSLPGKMYHTDPAKT